MELKPCPFCGGKGISWFREQDEGHSYATVGCADCYCEIAMWVSPRDDGEVEMAKAIAAWNRRADVAVRDVRQVPEVVALLRAAQWARSVVALVPMDEAHDQERQNLRIAIRALDCAPSAAQSGEGLGEGIGGKIWDR